MKKNISLIASILILQSFLISCKTTDENGLAVAKINNGEVSLALSQEKIEKDINKLISPSELNLKIKSVDVIEIDEVTFLKVVGTNNETGMIALMENNGTLYELHDNKIPFILCYGCADGCQPEYKSPGWICSSGCSDCTKTTTVSDDFIFE